MLTKQCLGLPPPPPPSRTFAELLPGYETASSGVATACDLGTYRSISVDLSIWSATYCVGCGAAAHQPAATGLTTLATGTTSVAGCLVMPGYGLSADNAALSTVAVCAIGTVREGPHASAERPPNLQSCQALGFCQYKSF